MQNFLNYIFWISIAYCNRAVTALPNNDVNHLHYETIESYSLRSEAPCVDYYKYACGKWEQMHSEEEYTAALDKVDFEVNGDYVKIFDKLKKTSNYRKQQPFVKAMIDYYKSCFDLISFEPTNYWLSFKTYENVTRPLNLKGSEDTEITFKWWLLLGKMRKYSVNGIFITQFVLPREDNARLSIIDVDKPTGELAFKPLEKKELDVIFDYLEIRGRRSRRTIWKAVKEFEIKLAELDEITDAIGAEVLTLDQLNTTWLKEFLKTVLEVKKLKGDMFISIRNRSYLNALHELLKSYDASFLYDYLKFRFISFLHVDSPETFVENHCVSHMRIRFVQGMSWLFEQHHPEFVAEYASITNMFNALKAKFHKTLQTNANNFKSKILKFFTNKLNNMQINFGILPRNNTLEKLIRLYGDLQFNASNFYENHLKALRFQKRGEFKFLEIRAPSSNDDFYFLPTDDIASSATPFYLQSSNIVVVQTAILRLPFYHPGLHDVFKYSLLGFLIGHEISHGFDESGLSYDKNGNLQGPADDIKSNDIFNTHLDCLRQENAHVIDERIADISGLRWSYETFFEKANESGIEFTWTNVTLDKLFFQNFAMFFCSKEEGDSELAELSHGTYRSRIFEALKHFDKFGKAYGCQVGSPIRPQETCQLYR